jgi:hypothetical protein
MTNTEAMAKDSQVPQAEQISVTGQELENGNPIHKTDEKDFSAFSIRQRKIIALTASMTGLFSPFASNIYIPALNSIAEDLHVSNALINLTLTTYLVSELSLPEGMKSIDDADQIDTTRDSANFGGRIFRYRWPTTCLHVVLHHLHCRQHRTRSTKQLCSFARSALLTKRWQ